MRPNAQESMVFLRKMLTHTSPDGSGYPTVISPALEDPVRLSKWLFPAGLRVFVYLRFTLIYFRRPRDEWQLAVRWSADLYWRVHGQD